MRSMFAGVVIAVSLVMAGCAAQVVRSSPASKAEIKVLVESSKRVVLQVSGSPTAAKAADWEEFRGAWRSAFAAEAAAANIAFSWRDGEASPDGQAGTLVSVQVNDYRYVSAGARFGLGIMTGNAFVDAKLRLLDASNGKVFGEDTINTSSSAWQGVFSAMTPKQLEAIAKDVMADISKH